MRCMQRGALKYLWNGASMIQHLANSAKHIDF